MGYKTIDDYANHLAADVSALELHQHTINIMLHKIIEKGGNSRLKLDWDAIHAAAVLIAETKKQCQIKEPGFDWVPREYYNSKVDEWGSLEENRAKGHREFQHPEDGRDGVLMPETPITKIEFSTIHSAAVQMRSLPT